MTETQRFGVELRAELTEADTGWRLRGHAAVFGQLANLPGHYEQINARAFDQVLADDTSDVRALINHDPNQLLGRQSAGTLKVDVDDRGLAFDVDLPDTSYARDLQALIRRGDLTGASFGFIPGADTWEQAPDGRQIRTHTSIRGLRDVSVVTWPAYDATDVMLRSITIEPAATVTPEPNASRLVRARARIHLPLKEQQ